MTIGEIIGSVSPAVRAWFSAGKAPLFSVRGMSLGELQKINQGSEELFALMKPIMVEYENIVMGKFFKNPNMTPGEIKQYYDNQFTFIVESVSSELRARERNKK